MKASDLIKTIPSPKSAIEPRLIREPLAARYVGSPVILGLFESAGWVRAAFDKHKLKFYDLRRLDAAIDRLEDEELPVSSIASSEGAK